MFEIRKRIRGFLNQLTGSDKPTLVACLYRGECEKYDPIRERICHDVRAATHLCPGYQLFSRVKH